MAIVRKVMRENNTAGRLGDTIQDGPFTLAVEIVGCAIVVTQPGDNLELHRNYDLCGQNFYPRTMECERSGVDGFMLVTVFGFTPDTGDSGYITIKLDGFRELAPPTSDD